MRGVVVAPQLIVVEAGVRVLKKGGDAVDAAATCVFAQMVDTHRVVKRDYSYHRSFPMSRLSPWIGRNML